MNSGYFRHDEDGHWYHLPEQLVEYYDWAEAHPDKTRNFQPGLFQLKGHDPITMTGEEMLELFEPYRIDGDPTMYKTILFIPGQ